MRKGGKQQEVRCANCYEHDEKQMQIQKLVQRCKVENDTLVRQMRNIAEESKRIIETLPAMKQNQQAPAQTTEQEEETNTRALELAKKQLEIYEKRIKLAEKKEEDLTLEDVTEYLRKIQSDFQQAKDLNYELKKAQREHEKLLSNEKFGQSRKELKQQNDLLAAQVQNFEKTLQRKQENKEKCLKKIEEVEARYKEVCTKNGVAPIARPDFTVVEPDFASSGFKESMKPVLLREPKESSKLSKMKEYEIALNKSKSEATLNKPKKLTTAPAIEKSKKAVEEVPVKTPVKLSAELLIEAKQNILKVNKSIASFEKSHVQTMMEMQNKEMTLLAQKEELEGELELIQKECNKASALLKELQGMPKDLVLESSKPNRGGSGSQENSDGFDDSPISAKALLMNKNKVKRDLQGAKMISEQAKLWADYNNLPVDRNYRISSMKFYHKDNDILRLELQYLLGSGEIETSSQPEGSESVVSDKDIKVVDIQFGRTETIMELSGLQDSNRITYLRIKTSQYREFTVGAPRISVQQKEFKFPIVHTNKPISIFGCFDISKYHGKRILAQLGIELMKKELSSEPLKKLTNKNMSAHNIFKTNLADQQQVYA